MIPASADVSVSCMVTNPKTGEILAVCTLPSYNLNDIPRDDVSLLNHANISSSTYSSYKDEEVREIINSYTVNNAEFMAAKNKVLGKVVGSFNYQHQLANLAARAAYEYAKDKYDFDYVVVNSQRTTLSATNSLTYGTLFTSIPFENKVVLAEVTGSSLKKELGYDSISMYRVDNEPFDQNKNYKILCVDYTVYHMNANRQYNYFPGHVDLGNVKLNGEDYYLRDMVADYILDVDYIQPQQEVLLPYYFSSFSVLSSSTTILPFSQ